MSTHNIGFYVELTKIIFELSSNIIKYAPYLFFCGTHRSNSFVEEVLHELILWYVSVSETSQKLKQ